MRPSPSCDSWTTSSPARNRRRRADGTSVGATETAWRAQNAEIPPKAIPEAAAEDGDTILRMYLRGITICVSPMIDAAAAPITHPLPGDGPTGDLATVTVSVLRGVLDPSRASSCDRSAHRRARLRICRMGTLIIQVGSTRIGLSRVVAQSVHVAVAGNRRDRAIGDRPPRGGLRRRHHIRRMVLRQPQYRQETPVQCPVRARDGTSISRTTTAVRTGRSSGPDWRGRSRSGSSGKLRPPPGHAEARRTHGTGRDGPDAGRPSSSSSTHAI